MARKDAAICILNYNGHTDTIECLESIFQHENLEEYTILVMDNGSNEESINALKSYFEKLKQKSELLVTVCNLRELSLLRLNEYDLVLIESKENYGFAVGNNYMADAALTYDFKYLVLLNNDTTLIMPSVKHLTEFMNDNSNYDVATSNITYYDNPNKVWNAGGRIYYGMRKYYGTNHVDAMKKRGQNVLPITFVTGCFMMVRAKIVKEYGLFTDLFFFGEEDFDFSIRMKKNKVNMCCLLDSKIYHKVGGTKKIVYKDINLIRKKLTGYLNRFIDMKQHYSKIQWSSWRLISSFYLFISMLLNGSANIGQALKFVMVLNRLSVSHDRVDKKLYEEILGGRYIS